MKKISLTIIGLSLIQLASAQSWNTTGNVLANPTTDYLGTSTSQALRLQTNSIKRLEIGANGEFRFGSPYSMTNPLYNFSGNEQELLTITDYTQLHINFPFPTGPGPYDLFRIQNYNTSMIPLPPNVPTPNTLFKVNHLGNVAIGLENPQAKLHVHNGYIQVSGNNTSGGPMIVLGGNTTAASGDWGMEYGVSTSVPTLKGLNFWKPTGSNNPGNYYLFIADNGNIGVGTDNPGTFKLAVEGKIGAREIQITNVSPWPDYVFGENYKKAELSDVEQFIKKHHHLPGINSATEIEENGGVNIGEMQLKQMEKIEELYLYMIDLKKENEQLKQQVQELEKKQLSNSSDKH